MPDRITSAAFQPIAPELRHAFTHDDAYEALIATLAQLDKVKVATCIGGESLFFTHFCIPAGLWHSTISLAIQGFDMRLRNEVLESTKRRVNTGGTTPRG